MLNFFDLFQIDTLYVILGMTVIIIALLVLYIVNIVKLKHLKNRIDTFMCGKDAKSLEELINIRFAEIDKLKKVSNKHTDKLKAIDEEMLTVYKKVGIVKYDAFNEMGGKLSFALAMLDKSNNGYIINAMHSREGCYTYVKEIINGESYITLGEEEKKALESAIKQDSISED